MQNNNRTLILTVQCGEMRFFFIPAHANDGQSESDGHQNIGYCLHYPIQTIPDRTRYPP